MASFQFARDRGYFRRTEWPFDAGGGDVLLIWWFFPVRYLGSYLLFKGCMDRIFTCGAVVSGIVRLFWGCGTLWMAFRHNTTQSRVERLTRTAFLGELSQQPTANTNRLKADPFEAIQPPPREAITSGKLSPPGGCVFITGFRRIEVVSSLFR